MAKSKSYKEGWIARKQGCLEQANPYRYPGDWVRWMEDLKVTMW